MSKNIQQLNDDELDLVSGGQITFSWNGTTGSIGMDGYNPFILTDRDAFAAYYNSVQGTMSDVDILRNLVAMGIAVKP